MTRRVFACLVALALVVPLGAVILAGVALAQAPAPDPVAALCSNNGAWLYWAFGIFGGASLLANLDKRIPEPLRTMVHVLGLNFFALMRNSAPPPMTVVKSAVALFFLVGLAGLIAACTPSQLQQAQQIAAVAAPAVQVACQATQQDLADAQTQLKGGANKTVASYASYVNAACPVINGAVTVAANVAADPTSVAWLQGISSGLKAATAPAAAPAPAAPAAAN